MSDNIDAKLPSQPEHNSDGTVKPGYLPVAPVEHKPRVTDTDPKAARRAERPRSRAPGEIATWRRRR